MAQGEQMNRLVKMMEWLFGCPWNEQAEKSIRDRKISEENAQYGQLTSIAYEETLKGLSGTASGSMSVEMADALMLKLAVLGVARDNEIQRIREEFEKRRQEMSIKSKWFVPRLWHEWRRK
jgi:hypothetical protein